MLHFSTLLLSFSVVGIVSAAPAQFNKRVDQQTIASVQVWEGLCNKAGGGADCSNIAVTAASKLLAAPGPCEQQDSADSMVDLSKKLNSQPMITAAQIFGQQARNSPTNQFVPYCQKAPKNPELNGVFQCQFQGENSQTFVGGLAVGAPGTIPFGQTTPVNPPGSCPANPSGTIPDGVQLSDIVKSPGNVGSAAGTPAPAPAAASVSAAQATSSAAQVPTPSAASTAAAQPTPSAAASAAPAAAPAAGSDFHHQNAQLATTLNQMFQSLTPQSSCTDGQTACVGGQFGQCVGGKFELTSCAAGEVCTALPLVNKPGTSVTCDTMADAAQRIVTAENQ